MDHVVSLVERDVHFGKNLYLEIGGLTCLNTSLNKDHVSLVKTTFKNTHSQVCLLSEISQPDFQ